MDEKRIKTAALEAGQMWLSDRLACATTTGRMECRTCDGRGRADVVVIGAATDGQIVTLVVEAKSRFERAALHAWRDEGDGQIKAGALLQVGRYPANYRVLACPENLLMDHPGDRALLQALCERYGVGLIVVNWYREWRWLSEPRRVDTPPLWADCLEGYASGTKLRASLA